MKTPSALLKSLAARLHARAKAQSRPLLLPLLTLVTGALASLASPALWAALPSITVPANGIGGGTCAAGDIMCFVGAYFKEYIGIVAVVVAALFLIAFALGSFSKWRAYSAGREDVASLKEFMFLGAIVSGVVVLLAYLAVQYAS